MKKYTLVLIFALSLSATANADPLIYTGPLLSFSKADFADPMDALNQDRITELVWITRANNRGIFNAAFETGYTSTSPVNTEWAFSGINGNAFSDVNAENYSNLVFSTWVNAVESDPLLMVGRDAVLHLIAEDHYIDIKFRSWTFGNSGGGFSYERTTLQTVPEPSSTMLLIGCGIAVGLGRRRRRT